MVHIDKLTFWHVLISNECGFRTLGWKKVIINLCGKKSEYWRTLLDDKGIESITAHARL